MSIKDSLATLDELYTKTKMDWTLDIHLVLTEPVMAWVSIVPEGFNMTRYSVTCKRDEIEDGVAKAATRVHREVILGERIGMSVPFTNPDDRVFEAALAEGLSVRDALWRVEAKRRDEAEKKRDDGRSRS